MVAAAAAAAAAVVGKMAAAAAYPRASQSCTGLNRPLFHIDLTSALQSAVANAERKGGEEEESAGDVDVDVKRGVGTKVA